MEVRKLLKILSHIFSNRISQKVLERNILASQYLRGVGAGAGVLGSGEEKVIGKLVGSLSRESICVFDVGANKGDFISLIEEEVEKEREIHAFEPLSSTYEDLQNRYGGKKGIITNKFALGKKIEEREVYYDEEGSGLTSMTKRDISHIDKKMSKSESIKVNTIDNYCSENNIDEIDILKVDVEGHELDVFEGANKMMKNDLVKYVIFEFGGCSIDTRTYMKDYFSFFGEVGFKRISRITPSGYLFELNGYNEKIEQFMTTNYLVEI